MFPPSSAAQVGLTSIPRGLSTTALKGPGASLSFRYMERSRLRSGTRDAANPTGERSRVLRATLILESPVWRRLRLAAVVPYVRTEARSSGRVEMASGIGDTALIVKASI